MNEHLESNSSRMSDKRNANAEQHHAAHPQRERGAAQAGNLPAAKCGLDTGSRGWRYVYQTH